MCITNTFQHTFIIEIQASEVAGIGGVAKSDIDGIGAVIDRNFQ